jgi:hypothetical protein
MSGAVTTQTLTHTAKIAISDGEKTALAVLKGRKIKAMTSQNFG